MGRTTERFLDNGGLMRRLFACLIDSTLALLLAAIVTNLILTSSNDFNAVEARPHETKIEDFAGYPVIIALLGAFFAAFWFLGRSPGGLILRLRPSSQDSDDRPSLLSALLRGTLTAAFLLASIVLLASGFSDRGTAFNTMDYVAVVTSAAVVLLGALGYLWLLWDKERCTLQDRLSGVRVIRTGLVAGG
jgi:hypothetical protein